MGTAAIKAAKRVVNRLRFWLTLPFARLGFWMRKLRRDRRNYPTLWLSPTALIGRDLELIDDDHSHRLDASLVDLLVQRRDKLADQINKSAFLTFSIYIFLFANYYTGGIEFSFAGFNIRDFPGLSEFLIVLSNTISLRTLVHQGTKQVLDAAIGYAITKAYPRDLGNVIGAAFFEEHNMGKYFQLNLPHIVQTPMQSNFGQFVMFSMLMVLVIIMLLVVTLNGFVLVRIWNEADLGIISKVVCGFVVVMGFVGFAHLWNTRLPMPYRDYTLLHKMDVMNQLHPDRAMRFREELYRDAIEDEWSMVEKGFMKKPSRGS